jgi:hypothetical protein
MNQNDKKLVTERLSARVSTGLLFIKYNYLDNNPTPDVAWIRNIYILLSFYTELLLKQIFIIKENFRNLKDLDSKLRRLGHDLKIIADSIGKNDLPNFGIKKISFVNKEYFVETDNCNFYVKDFNDIRYDFLDGRVRIIKGDEHIMFKQQIEVMLKINDNLKPLSWRYDNR